MKKQIILLVAGLMIAGNLLAQNYGSITPAFQTIASGGSVTLQHSGGSILLGRQWQISENNGNTWTDIRGATGTSYNTGTLINNGLSNITKRYRVRVNGGNSFSAQSVITVSPALTPGNITPFNPTVSSGNSVTLQHVGSNGVTSRQWQQSTNNGSTWTNISGATGTSYNTGVLTNDEPTAVIRRYRVRINGQNIFSAESEITVKSAEQEFTDRMNHIFQHVDKSRITTGLLSDYGLQLVEPEYFDGVPADSNYVNMSTWKMLYAGMFTSKINNNVSLTFPETVFEQIDNASHSTASPVATMHYQYNALNEDAIALNMLQIINGDQLLDVPGGASPYLTKQLFAAAPQRLFFDDPAVSFVFNSTLWYTNANKTVQKLEIKFDTETGYLIAGWNTPVDHTFDEGGVKTIYFRLTYTDNTFFTSQTNIFVAEQLSGRNVAFVPDDSIVIPANAQHSGGVIQIKYSDASNGVIRKPLIVADQLDPYDVFAGIIDDIKENNLGTFLGINTGTSSFSLGIKSPVNDPDNRTFYDDLNLEEYDIVYLDYNKSHDCIKRNAKLLIEAIEWVNLQKENVPNAKQNVVLGIIMGGLVARVALREMELDPAKDHDTWKYISFDSPHKGANIPVGFQAAVRHIQNTQFNILFFNVLNYTHIAPEAKGAINLLNSEAAKQMLIYYVQDNYSITSSFYNSFQTFLNGLGFPQNCINVAISNGSINGTTLYDPGTLMVDWNETYRFNAWIENLAWFVSPFFFYTNYPHLFLNFFPGNSHVRLELKINAINSNSRVYYGRAFIRKKLFWIWNTDIDIVKRSVPGIAGMHSLDGASGGRFSMENVSGQLPFDTSFVIQDQFSFIPTVSSLALSDWQTKLLANNSNGISTPFDTVYTQSANQQHTALNTANAKFLYNQLKALQTIISGPTTVCVGQVYTYSVTDAPPGFTWDYSGNFTLVSGSATSTSIMLRLDYYSYYASVSVNLGSTQLASLGGIVVRNPPLISDGIEGYEYVGSSGAYMVNHGGSQPYSYYWYVENASNNYWQLIYSGPHAQLLFWDETDLTLYVQVSNSCGSDIASKDIYATGRGGGGSPSNVTVYPNPVKDILIVEIDASNGGAIGGSAITYDARLYDGLGNMLQQQFTQGGRLEFNVSALPEGVYYLHVYDGVSPTPEIHQVVVER